PEKARSGAGTTSNTRLVAPVRPLPDASRLKPVPAWSIERPAKVATPATALTAPPPASVPLGLPASFVSVTVAVLAVRFPCASRTSTSTAGVIVCPAPTFDGSTRKARWSAAPAWKVTPADWSSSVPEAVAEYVTASAVPSATVKVAMPAPFVVVPKSGEIEELPPFAASVTFAPAIGFPKASSTVTVIVPELPASVLTVGDGHRRAAGDRAVRVVVRRDRLRARRSERRAGAEGVDAVVAGDERVARGQRRPPVARAEIDLARVAGRHVPLRVVRGHGDVERLPGGLRRAGRGRDDEARGRAGADRERSARPGAERVAALPGRGQRDAGLGARIRDTGDRHRAGAGGDRAAERAAERAGTGRKRERDAGVGGERRGVAVRVL